MQKNEKSPKLGHQPVCVISPGGAISAGWAAKRTGYRVNQVHGVTRVSMWHNEGYPQRRDLGDEVTMPKRFYDLHTAEGKSEFSRDFLKIFMNALNTPRTGFLPAKSYVTGKLDRQVFTIDYDAQKVVTQTYRDLFDLVETIPRPEGIGTKYYAKEVGFEDQMWAVCYFDAGRENRLTFAATENEAISLVEDLWIYDIENHFDTVVLSSFEQAQELLQQYLDDLSC